MLETQVKSSWQPREIVDLGSDCKVGIAHLGGGKLLSRA
jgi:hypothetical protein